MNGIIDFHTHAFPDNLAHRAMAALEAEAEGVTAFLDGKVSSLLRSMDKAGIEQSVLCSIATRPSQFDAILRWSKEVRSDRIIPFPSLHPDDADFRERIKRVKGEGFRGLKFHPYYQEFKLDEDRVMPIYEEICRENLLIVMHTGFDIAFDRVRICDPVRILNVYEKFPDLKLVTTHLGAWEDWDEVQRHLIGKPVYMEISFALELIEGERARAMIEAHPRGYVLFGTDSPWTDQSATRDLLKGLGLGPEREAEIFRGAAQALMASVD